MVDMIYRHFTSYETKHIEETERHVQIQFGQTKTGFCGCYISCHNQSKFCAMGRWPLAVGRWYFESTVTINQIESIDF
jgi:hypothetical protein